MRDISTGRDEEINTGDLLKAGVTCAADGAVLFAGALESETTATQIYVGRAGSAPQALTQGDGFKMPSKIDAAGHTLLFLVPNQGPFRAAAAGGHGAAVGNCDCAGSIYVSSNGNGAIVGPGRADPIHEYRATQFTLRVVGNKPVERLAEGGLSSTS